MKVAIFDLDGTIADTLFDLADATNFGLEQLGCPTHSYEAYKSFIGNGAMKLCFRALPDDKKDDTEKLYELFKIRYNEHLLDKTALYDGIRETMQKLVDSDVRLAVATNKPQDAARKLVSFLLPDFEFIKVLGGCSEREKKPDPAIINEILSEVSDYEKAYMIGDSNVDIQTAKNSGLASIGCIWGFRSRQELENEDADFIAESPANIADFIISD